MVAEIYNALHETSQKEILWPLTYYTDILLGVKKNKTVSAPKSVFKSENYWNFEGQINLVQCFGHKIVKKKKRYGFLPEKYRCITPNKW